MDPQHTSIIFTAFIKLNTRFIASFDLAVFCPIHLPCGHIGPADVARAVVRAPSPVSPRLVGPALPSLAEKERAGAEAASAVPAKRAEVARAGAAPSPPPSAVYSSSSLAATPSSTSSNTSNTSNTSYSLAVTVRRSSSSVASLSLGSADKKHVLRLLPSSPPRQHVFPSSSPLSPWRRRQGLLLFLNGQRSVAALHLFHHSWGVEAASYFLAAARRSGIPPPHPPPPQWRRPQL